MNRIHRSAGLRSSTTLLQATTGKEQLEKMLGFLLQQPCYTTAPLWTQLTLTTLNGVKRLKGFTIGKAVISVPQAAS